MSTFLLLTDNDKKILQPQCISVELMSHQKTMIQRMLDIEETGEIKINNYSQRKYSSLLQIPGKEAILNTNFGVLGDKVGSGKTLMIITLISIKRTIKEKHVEMGGSQFYSLKIKNNSQNINTNLIIVPHKLLPQWKESFDNFSPNTRVYTVAANKDIDKIVRVNKEIKKNWENEDIIITSEEIVKKNVDEFDAILVGETMYKRFYKACENFKFNRIIIDEADTIKLPRELSFQFNFLWLVTGTPKGLFDSNKVFINKLFKEDYLDVNKYFVIKNDDNYIEQSIKLPHPKRLKIKCITPKELNLIKDLIPPSILQMINAGNSEQAIKTLNCNIDTDENILQVITKNLRDSIANKEIELEAERKKNYNINQKKEHEQRIKFIETMLNKLRTKYEEIKKKIYTLNEDYCPICMSNFTNPVMVECCKNAFCFDCLAVSVGELKNNKCPYCRQIISQKDIHIFSSDNSDNNKLNKSDESNKYQIKDKLEVLVDLISNKPNGSFMIFANYMETFSKIEHKLIEIGISYCILKGHASVVKKHIDDFAEKKVKILMLNAQFFGAGMNLQMTTDIIMYHRFNKEMEEQIIGRAQRLGRSNDIPLNVYYLLHENESNDIENNFHFEEQENIHYLDWLEQNNNIGHIKEEKEVKEVKEVKVKKTKSLHIFDEDEDEYNEILKDSSIDKKILKIKIVDDIKEEKFDESDFNIDNFEVFS